MLQHAVQIIVNESEQELMKKTSDIVEIITEFDLCFRAHINYPYVILCILYILYTMNGGLVGLENILCIVSPEQRS